MTSYAVEQENIRKVDGLTIKLGYPLLTDAVMPKENLKLKACRLPVRPGIETIRVEMTILESLKRIARTLLA
jgi:hypothetical protein